MPQPDNTAWSSLETHAMMVLWDIHEYMGYDIINQLYPTLWDG